MTPAVREMPLRSPTQSIEWWHALKAQGIDTSLVIYPDAGHGGIFQYHSQFVPKVLAFLAA